VIFTDLGVSLRPASV